MSYQYETLYETIFVGTSAISNLVSLAAAVLTIVALWKMYTKANEPGWAAIIPFYSGYILYKISGKKKLFWAYLVLNIVTIVLYIVLIVGIAGSITTSFTGSSQDYTVALMMVGLSAVGVVACAIALLVIRIFQCIGLAKSFGLSGGYAVGLIFIPVVFYCIIAFNNKISHIGSGYVPNGQNPYGQAPVYMNPYTGQQQNYGQNPYAAPQQNYEQNPYSAQYNNDMPQNGNQEQ